MRTWETTPSRWSMTGCVPRMMWPSWRCQRHTAAADRKKPGQAYGTIFISCSLLSQLFFRLLPGIILKCTGRNGRWIHGTGSLGAPENPLYHHHFKAFHKWQRTSDRWLQHVPVPQQVNVCHRRGVDLVYTEHWRVTGITKQFWSRIHMVPLFLGNFGWQMVAHTHFQPCNHFRGTPSSYRPTELIWKQPTEARAGLPATATSTWQVSLLLLFVFIFNTGNIKELKNFGCWPLDSPYSLTRFLSTSGSALRIWHPCSDFPWGRTTGMGQVLGNSSWGPLNSVPWRYRELCQSQGHFPITNSAVCDAYLQNSS